MRLTLRQRLLVSFFAAIVLVAGLALGLGVRAIVVSVFDQAKEQVGLDLKTASALLANRQEYVLQIVRSFASESLLDEIFTTSEPRPLRERLELQRLNYGLDVLSFCDAETVARLRTAEPYAVGDKVQPDPVLKEALEGKASVGLVLLSLRRLEQESAKAAERARITVIPTERARPRAYGPLDKAMAIWAAVPVRDSKTDRLKGVVYGGIVLNGRNEIVDEIRNLLFAEQVYKNKPLATVTIFLDDVRIATNVQAPAGGRAVGTQVSEEVYNHVVKKHKRWLGRAFVVDDWYISAYAPIDDPGGRTIGMLYVGVLEQRYADMRNRLLLWFLTPGLVGLLVSVFLATTISGKISRSIYDLVAAAQRIARGNLEEPVKVDSDLPEVASLVAAIDHMRESIRQRDEQLQRQNEQLQEALEHLQAVNRGYMEMLGFVTHELKSPVASMYASAASLRDGIGGPLTETQRKLVATIIRNCEYLEDMVKNYLDLSRIERGEFEVRPQEVELLQDIVVPCIEQLAQQAEFRRIQICCDVPDGVYVNADPELARIALTNYLSNAIKYGKEDGRIEIRARRYDGQVKISVWNEGPGFKPEQKEQLFKKFSRLSDSQTKRQKGSGLGLYLVREITERHGGEVGATSEPGKWAEFWFTLPLSEKTKGALMNDLRKVLIVDDDVDLVETLKTAMEAEGFAVEAAYSGSEGLAKARSDRPDVIVLDVKMETLGEGFHVARELRRDERTRDIPIIMLTSVNQDNLGFRYDADEQWNPVDVFLDKPVEPARLIQEIRNLRVTGGSQ